MLAKLEPEVLASMRTPPEGARWVPAGSPPVDQRAQATAAYARLRSQLAAFDARPLGLEFELPIFFLQGEDDAYTAASEVEEYEVEIRAPAKSLVRVEGGGHSSFFLREPFRRELERHLRPFATR